MKLDEVVKVIVDNFKPYSIFLYGSKATNSSNSISDYEIGVIFEEEKYHSRSDIANLVKDKNYAIYPFRLNEILNYDIDTPFQKNIYMNILINGGSNTLYGKPVLQELKAPEITNVDLLSDINFNLGMALCSVRVYKTGNIELANDFFYKSCLYVTRDYIYYTSGKLCLSYNEIYEQAKRIIELQEFRELLDTAHFLRNNPNSNEIGSNIYFKNISYINKFVLNKCCK